VNGKETQTGIRSDGWGCNLTNVAPSKDGRVRFLKRMERGALCVGGGGEKRAKTQLEITRGRPFYNSKTNSG